MSSREHEGSGSVTLDDIARLSGVSRATASRALNQRDGVRPDVRERVTLLANSLGYRPNRAARNLATGRSSVIGLVIPSADLRHDPYGAAMVHAIGRAATQHDQGLMLLLDSDEPGRTVGHILRDGLIDGVIVSAVAAGETWVEELLTADLATVLIGNHPTRNDVDLVDVENELSSERITRHLFEQGCKRLATVTGPLDRVDANLRLDGFRKAHRVVGKNLDEALVIPGDFGQASGLRAGELIATMRVRQRPDGIVSANDEMARGVLRGLQRHGISVPGDIAVVGFDGDMTDPIANEITLTSVMQPFDQIATAAVAELLARIDGSPPKGRALIHPDIFYGQSSDRPATKAAKASSRRTAGT